MRNVVFQATDNKVMDGAPPGRQLELRARVAVAIPSAEHTIRLTEALVAAGFEVASATGIVGIADAADPEELLVAIIDADETDWLRQVADLTRRRPLVRPLALADVDPDEFLAALSAGVAGFVPPSAGVDAILRSVHSLLDDGVSIPRGMVSALVAEVRHGRGRTVETASGRIDVTDREWEILQLMLQRRSTREMAEVLYVSVGTVRSHVSALMKKLGAVDREDAIRLIQRGQR